MFYENALKAFETPSNKRRRGVQLTHRAWMIRGFALTLAAVTLRFILRLEIAAGIPFRDAYQLVSWMCWVPNLAVAEMLIRRERAGRPRPTPAAAVRA